MTKEQINKIVNHEKTKKIVDELIKYLKKYGFIGDKNDKHNG